MNIRDIAKLAGVGVSTVSRVLNNHIDVKESTRERVMEIIKESNYIPNNSARILKQNNLKNIGVLVKGVFNPFFSEMINVIGSIITNSKYTMILQQNDYSFGEDFNSLQSFIKDKRLQGVICLGGNFEAITRSGMESLEVPVVLTSVNTEAKSEEDWYYSSVGIDNVESGYKATKYLIDLGHRNIAVMIGEKNDIGVSWSRLKGYKKAIEEIGLKFNEKELLVGDYNYTTAYDSTKKYLSENEDTTALFCMSDIMAVGAAKAILDTGIKIGEDISLVGFDGMDISKYYNPGITTMKQPKKEMAEKAANLLLDLIKNNCKNQHIILSTKLIERESSKKRKM